MERAQAVRRRTGGRSARVVASVLEATLDSLARGGYAGLTFDQVAERAGVSRTTIYRRWPSKPELVRAALLRFAETRPVGRDTGTVRGDLLELLRVRLFDNRALRERGSGLLRGLMDELMDPELRAIGQLCEERFEGPVLMAIERGIARGELPAGTDPRLVMEPIFSTLTFKVLVMSKEPDLAFAERLVDLVLAGARAGTAVR